MDDKVFFKIVIPNYNNGGWIKRCLDSMFAQTFDDFVVVVVDDCSTDGSYESVIKYKETHDNLFCLKLPEKGFQSTARNVGFEYPVDSRYVMFFDGDDWLYDNKVLADIHDELLKRPVDMLVGQYVNVFKGGMRLGRKQKFDLRSDKFFDNNGFYCWVRFVKSDKVVKFPEKLGAGEDVYQYFVQCDNVESYGFTDRIVTCHNKMNECSVMSAGSYKNTIRNICQFDYFCKLALLLKEKKIRNVHIRRWVWAEMMLYSSRMKDFIDNMRQENYV